MKVNKAGIDLIKQFEGCKLKAYKDSVGIWTVGYGLTTAAGFIEVTKGTAITQDEADYYLEKAVEKFAGEIAPAFQTNVSENEFSACVSLAYNIGSPRFKKSSVLKHLNAGDRERAADAFLLWNKAGGKVLKGLERRRAAERKFFLTPARSVKPMPEPAPKPAPQQHWLLGLLRVILSLFSSPWRPK